MRARRPIHRWLVVQGLLQHNVVIVNKSNTPDSQIPVVVWLAGALLWLLAVAYLALRAVLPWDGAWISVLGQRPGTVSVLSAEAGSLLQAGDLVLAVNGYPVGERVREAMAAPLRTIPTEDETLQTVYLIERNGRPGEVAVVMQPGRLLLPLQRWGILLFGFILQIVGAFLLLRRPDNLAVRVIFLTGACLLSYSALRAAELHMSELLSGLSWWIYLALGVLANIGWQVGLVWLALAFPRPHAWLSTHRSLAVGLTAALLCGTGFTLLLVFGFSVNPLLTLSGLPAFLLVTQLVLFSLAMMIFAVNYRSLGAEDRLRAKWVILALSATLVFGLAISTLPDVFVRVMQRSSPAPDLAALRNNLIWVIALVIPGALAIAILRHQLFDIDLVINRALVWGALSTMTVALYILLVGALSWVFHASESPLAFFLATGVIAVLFQPIHQRLQRGVNRLMYGERDDPYTALARLGQRLGGALAPDMVAPVIVESIASALKLPYVELSVRSDGLARSHHASPDLTDCCSETAVMTIDDQAPLAVWGKPTIYPPIRLPLTHHGQIVGELTLAPRGPREELSTVDQHLLNDLARQAGVALFAAQQTWQAQRLTRDLQHSRERLVAAREEERRRLRRDLHDGLGPVLASLTLKVDATHDELAYDTASAAQMLLGLKSDIQAAVEDVRRLAYDLRPPALDDLGLAASLSLLAERSQTSSLTISCDLPEHLPPLPAAVEVAIYRIANEALTNVVRHAEASTCTMQLAVSGDVELSVSDDGCGLPLAVTAGVGLISMRERAEELGGSCVITSAPRQGTTVNVWLPLEE
ncbi:MAG: hypothetical protein IAE81_23710 [Caldilineaceae bacterium]|nr:hypothetical protein [Caldilineaceae bacterium]